MPVIEVQNLSKVYRVFRKREGLRASVRSHPGPDRLIPRTFRRTPAICRGPRAAPGLSSYSDSFARQPSEHNDSHTEHIAVHDI